MQHEFVEQLVEKYPLAAIERYSMKGYAMDAQLAAMYLTAMQQSNQYGYFRLQDLVERAQLSPVQREALVELEPTLKGMTKAKQVAAVLNVLRNPMSSGVVGSTAAAASTLLPLRGMDPKQPLFVQVQKSTKGTASTLLGGLTKVFVAFVVVSALYAIMDEKGVGKAMGMSRWFQTCSGSGRYQREIQGRQGSDGSQGGIGRNCTLPQGSIALYAIGRKVASWIVAHGTSRNGKDLVGQGDCGRSRCAILLFQWFAI